MMDVKDLEYYDKLERRLIDLELSLVNLQYRIDDIEKHKSIKVVQPLVSENKEKI